MLKSAPILKFFIAAIFISMQAHNGQTTQVFTTTVTEHRIETKAEPSSLMQKINAFVDGHKTIITGAFIVTILAMYPKRAPFFIEWMLINLFTNILTDGKSHVSVHFNSYHPTYWSHRPYWSRF